VCSASGAKAKHAAEKFGFRFCTTSEAELLAESTINTAVIATRHSLHARQVVAALKAGKHVFCEKPLCLSEDELHEIIVNVLANPAPLRLMVGFNRRFAPMSVKLREFLRRDVHRAPLYVHYRVNAGYLPPNHWTQDPAEGGRMLGEVCHFLDYLTFVCGAPVEVEARALGDNGAFCDDNVVIHVGFANGSRGVVSYMANGDRAHSKERIEVFGAGKTAVIEDFRTLELSEGGKLHREQARLGQDKGHRGEWEAFVRSFAEGKLEPVALDEIIGSTLLTLRALTALRTGERVRVDVREFKDRIRLGQ
jgi:predicted dehydrogenase